MALPLALLIPSLIKAGTGIWQQIQSSKYADTERPDYEIPQSLKDMLENAKQVASQTQLPGQSLAEEKLSAASAQGITAAKQSGDSPTSTLGTISNIIGSEQSKLRDLAASAATAWQTNQSTLRAAMQSMATEENKQWQYNEYLPYMAAMEKAAALQKSGQENLFAGVSDAVGGAIAYNQNESYMKMLDDYYKGSIANGKLAIENYGKTPKVTTTPSISDTKESSSDDLFSGMTMMNKAKKNTFDWMYQPTLLQSLYK
jgi:hypothetical protein